MTTLHVKENTWRELNKLKKPGETMDDVIRKLLEIMNEVKETQNDLLNSDNTSFDELLDEFCSITDEEFQGVISGTKRSFQKRNLRENK